ncbi:MAG: 2-amino-4-hydroxy-6-hydroxymethyldihydropteridine diphosphokinase [Micrococcales bacterium]
MSEAVEAILALGSNLGDRVATLDQAIKDLDAVEGIKVKKVSPLVESLAHTEAGPDETKPRYLNGVIRIKTTLKPKALLEAIREVENQHGRVRLERWGSRTLDIDIITYANEIKDTKTLTIPHPRAYQRAFVLVPWAMIDETAVLPGQGSVKELAEKVQKEVWLYEGN